MLKLYKIVLFLASCAVLLNGSTNGLTINNNSLRKKAFEAGLKPIPKNKAEIEKIILKNNPNYSIFPITPERVELGKKLFLDPRLSKSGIISCNTCHNLGLAGVDGIQTAIGHEWKTNKRNLNSPTIYNAVFNKVQFWDGRAAHLQEQAKGPMQDEVEMAEKPEIIEQKINNIPGYVKDFKKAYGQNIIINFNLITATIAIFERTLITPSRYDSFLLGDDNALSLEEKRGLSTFINKRCTSCHNDINLGGKMSVFELASKYNYNNANNFSGDKSKMIKTPTLRNVELTPPYFHNGDIWDLKEAIEQMGKIQLGVNLNEQDIQDIEVFLKSLTGKMPNITYPMLPPSSKNISSYKINKNQTDKTNQ